MTGDTAGFWPYLACASGFVACLIAYLLIGAAAWQRFEAWFEAWLDRDNAPVVDLAGYRQAKRRVG